MPFKARKITRGIHWVGVIDWDRRLFDSLVPIPEGTSYNAYVVQGSEATALVDTVEATHAPMLLARLESLGIERLDYIVSNHSEQDHSGAIRAVLERFPEARVLCTPRGVEMLGNLLDLPEGCLQVVEDGEELSLGDITLKFVHFPWVHWPETMLTYAVERQTLFPCDLFGSHLATNSLFAPNAADVLYAAKIYYAQIMMPYRKSIAKNLPKVQALPLRFIAPSHGPVYDDPGLIVDAYADWVGPRVRNKVCLPFISMHASTTVMVDHLIDALTDHGVLVERFNLEEPDLGRIAMSLVDAATVVIGTPTVYGGAHPHALLAASLVGMLKPKTRHAAFIGSYGWGSRAPKQIREAVSKLKVEDLGEVQAKGAPTEQVLADIDALAARIAERHAALDG